MKKTIGILVCFAFLLVGVGSVYADPYEARPHEWRDKQTFRKDVRVDGAIDANGTLNVEGAVTLQGTLSATTITGTATEFGIGTVSATEIANVTREIYFPMAGWATDGGNDLDEGSVPNIGDDDNIPSITWANSGETTAIQQTFRLPSTYVGDFTLYCLASSDTAVGTAGKIDWRIWVNNSGVVFDATAIEQTEVAMTTAQGASANTNNVLLTLTLDATGEAALTAGTWITVDIFNATTHATGNLELKGVHGTYTATQ